MATRFRKSRGIMGCDSYPDQRGISENDALNSINRIKAGRGFAGNDGGKTKPAEDKVDNQDPPTAIKGDDKDAVLDEEEETEATETESQPIILTVDMLNGIIAGAVNSAVKNVSDTFKSQQDKVTGQLKEQGKQLEDFFKNMGNPTPVGLDENGDKTRFNVNVNTRFGTGDGITGAAQEFENILSDAIVTPRRRCVDAERGLVYMQRDFSNACEFFRENRKKLRSDMELVAKKHGLLQHWRGGESDAATTKTDIPDLLLDYLSMVVRETHEQRFIYHQFVMSQLELGKAPGDVIRVHRFGFLGEPSAVADRELTPGTATNAGNQNIAENSVSVTLKERGLGKTTGSEPVAIPEFWSAYSMVDLESVVVRLLGHDANADQDLAIRSQYFATTRVYYNDNGVLTTVPGDVGAADDGTFTEEFAAALAAQADTDKILPFDNGKYVLILPPQPRRQLKVDMKARNRYMDKAAVADLTSVLNLTAADKLGGKVMGYVGDLDEFMVFTTNAHSVGAPGAEGVQTEALGVGSRTTRTSFVIGKAAVAEAVGMEVELRRDTNDDFGRLNRWIWLCHKGYGSLDVDPAIAASQQLRVYEAHTVDVPV